MTKADDSLALRSRRLADAKIIEGWMRGTYIVAGIFAIPSEAISTSDIQANIPDLYASTKAERRGRWPRGIAGTFLFPFYLGTGFGAGQIEWVQHRRPYRWAIWHEPVLYDTARNSVWMRSDYRHFGSAFYPLVFGLYRRAFVVIAERLQKPQPDFINGQATRT
jgi:hypothetical protein